MQIFKSKTTGKTYGPKVQNRWGWISQRESLSHQGRDLVGRLMFARLQQQELSNQLALLTRAKNPYIADLKTEIVQERTGVDLDALISDDWPKAKMDYPFRRSQLTTSGIWPGTARRSWRVYSFLRVRWPRFAMNLPSNRQRTALI